MQYVSGCTGLSGVILVSTVQNKVVYTAVLRGGWSGVGCALAARLFNIMSDYIICRKHVIYTA